MQNIRVSRYENPKAHGWAGHIEPEDKSWIAFVGCDGRPLFFLHRDPVTGGILSNDATDREKEIAELRALEGLRTGMLNDGSAEGLARGEPVFPLGVDGTGGVGINRL